MIFTSIASMAQLKNDAFKKTLQILKSDSQKLYLGFGVTQYLKNNEYSNMIADGYTLFGTQLNPSITYYASPTIRIDAGIFLQRTFGRDGYNEISPTFSIMYKKNQFSFLMGTLEGNLNHDLIEPLYDFESIFSNTIEEGLQLKYKGKWFETDTWLNWERGIFARDPFQEEFSVGSRINFSLWNQKNFNLKIPIHLLAHHKGGQIDNSPDLVLNLFNAAFGIEANWKLKTFLDYLSLDSYYVGHWDNSFVHQLPFVKGKAFYTNLSISKNGFTTILSYWNGNDFISAKGGQLYKSVSSSFKNSDFIDPKRELLFIRFLYDQKLSNDLTMSLRFEPYLDLSRSQLEWSAGFYLHYNPRFLLFKIK